MNHFQKSSEERKAIKEAKKAFKNNRNQYSVLDHDIEQLQVSSNTVKEKRYFEGIFEGEEILPEDYVVHLDYCYVMEFEGKGSVIKSDVQGSLNKLRGRLAYIHRIPKELASTIIIRNCNLGARNLL